MIAINRMHTNYPGSFPGLLRDLFIYKKSGKIMQDVMNQMSNLLLNITE